MLFFVIDFCICDGSSDPHYYTPDGAVIHFMGTCKYTQMQREGGFILVSSINKYGRHEKI
jgi:hypothetical protein